MSGLWSRQVGVMCPLPHQKEKRREHKSHNRQKISQTWTYLLTTNKCDKIVTLALASQPSGGRVLRNLWLSDDHVVIKPPVFPIFEEVCQTWDIINYYILALWIASSHHQSRWWPHQCQREPPSSFWCAWDTPSPDAGNTRHIWAGNGHGDRFK